MSVMQQLPLYFYSKGVTSIVLMILLADPQSSWSSSLSKRTLHSRTFTFRLNASRAPVRVSRDFDKIAVLSAKPGAAVLLLPAAASHWLLDDSSAHYLVHACVETCWCKNMPILLPNSQKSDTYPHHTLFIALPVSIKKTIYSTSSISKKKCNLSNLC